MTSSCHCQSYDCPIVSKVTTEGVKFTEPNYNAETVGMPNLPDVRSRLILHMLTDVLELPAGETKSLNPTFHDSIMTKLIG